MQQMYKVWPLVHGLRGVNGQGRDVDLAIGMPGWMTQDAAFAAVAAREVKLMAGASPGDLKIPEHAKVMRPEPTPHSAATESSDTQSSTDLATEEVSSTEETGSPAARTVSPRPAGRRGFYNTK